MPTLAAAACSMPRCLNRAVSRGRCADHRQTTSQRGYGRAHTSERAAALPGARCSNCGCDRELKRDHRIPRSLGGGEDVANKRWLCDCAEHRCHSRHGLKSNSRELVTR